MIQAAHVLSCDMKTSYALTILAVAGLTLTDGFAQTDADQPGVTATGAGSTGTGATALADEFFPKLDTNRDGLISRSEFTANFHLLPGLGDTEATGTGTMGTGTGTTGASSAATGTGAGAGALNPD